MQRQTQTQKKTILLVVAVVAAVHRSQSISIVEHATNAFLELKLDLNILKISTIDYSSFATLQSNTKQCMEIRKSQMKIGFCFAI